MEQICDQFVHTFKKRNVEVPQTFGIEKKNVNGSCNIRIMLQFDKISQPVRVNHF